MIIQLNEEVRLNLSHIEVFIENKEIICEDDYYFYKITTKIGYEFNTYKFKTEKELIEWYQQTIKQ